MDTRFFRHHRFPGLPVLAVSALAALLLAACTPEEIVYSPDNEPNTGLRTITLSASCEASATKAAIADNLSFSWTPGDQIAVWAGSETAGDYYTSATYVSGNRFSVQLSGTRRNYAVYPAGIADRNNATSSSLKVNLPAEYDFREVGSDYSPMPMLAVNTEGANLEFKHLGGLIRITIGSIPEGASYATVDLGKKINGSFPVHVASDGSYIVADESDGTTSTKFLIPSTGSVVLNLPVPTGEYNSITVKIFDASDNEISSESPEFSWTCRRAYGKKLSDENWGWVYVFGEVADATVTYAGGDATLAAAFQSYRTKGSVTEAVPYTLQYFYEKDGVEGWYDEAPAWLTAAPAGGTHAGGNAGEALNITVAPQVNSEPDEHHNELSARPPKTDFDLSTINVATGATVSRTTANCYVVQGSGTYKFPLVYGNGVKNGAVNESAYRAKAGPDATGYRPDDGVTNYLGSFKDHLDNNIYNGGDATSSPYLTTHLGKTAADFTAVLVWQDVLGLVTVNPDISGSGEDAYLSFSVPADYITQGNALMAVLVDDDSDGTPETIAWSWHIWVTEEDLTVEKEGFNGYKFAPVNIGWCEAKTETHPERSCQVRFVQNYSDKTLSAAILENANSITVGGNSPYYQWGRKDPQQASTGGSKNANKIYYPSNDAYSPVTIRERKTIGGVIQTPYVNYVPSGNYPRDWCSQTCRNLWNTVVNGTGADQYSTPVIKTIYDPSPVGFKMPPQAAYSGFTTDNFSWGAGGRTYTITTNNKLFFPAGGYRLENTPTNCGAYGYYWSAVPTANNDYFGYYLMFGGSSVSTRGGYNYRCYGFPVRPVKE